MYIHTHSHTHIDTYIYMYTYMYMCIDICIYKQMYIFKYPDPMEIDIHLRAAALAGRRSQPHRIDPLGLSAHRRREKTPPHLR